MLFVNVIFICYLKLWIMEPDVIIWRVYLIVSFLHSRDEYNVRQNQGHTEVQQHCILIILHLSKVYQIMFKKTWLILVKIMLRWFAFTLFKIFHLLPSYYENRKCQYNKSNGDHDTNKWQRFQWRFILCLLEK